MAHQPVDGEDQEQIDRNEQQVEAAGNIELPPPTQTDAERDEAQAAQVQALLEED